MGNEMYNLGEVAEYLHVSTETVRKLEMTGELVPKRVLPAGHRRYDWGDVVAYRKKFEKKEIPDNAQMMSMSEIHSMLGLSVRVLEQAVREDKLSPAIVLNAKKRLFLYDDVMAYAKSIGIR